MRFPPCVSTINGNENTDEERNKNEKDRNVAGKKREKSRKQRDKKRETKSSNECYKDVSNIVIFIILVFSFLSVYFILSFYFAFISATITDSFSINDALRSFIAAHRANGAINFRTVCAQLSSYFSHPSDKTDITACATRYNVSEKSTR